MASKSHRLVIIRFFFTNRSLVPTSVGAPRPETAEELLGRSMGRANGDSQSLVVPQAVSLQYFIDDLTKDLYELVSADAQERRNKNDWPYCVVKFVFARQAYAEPSAELLGRRDDILAGLRKMCYETLWQIKGFSNPFFAWNGEEIPGQYILSIALSGRQPLVDKNGKPICQRQKDDNGRLIGKPVPLLARRFLRLAELVG